MKSLVMLCALVIPVTALAQNPKGATYITAEEVALINKSPGVDRQIVNVDIGKSNLAVGVVHRGRSGAPAASPTMDRPRPTSSFPAAAHS
jgi:hypothetical protein